MVWLDLLTEGGQGLYFDAWKREVRRQGPAVEVISGLVGDGSYEGEVMVELSSGGCDVTFVDRFLNPAQLKEFLERISEEELIDALWQQLKERPAPQGGGLPLIRHDGPAADGYACHFRGDWQVREDEPGWHPAVA